MKKDLETQIVDHICKKLILMITKSKFNRLAHWREYKKRMARYEVKMKKIMKKYFKEQKQVILANIKTQKDIYTGWEFDNLAWNIRLQNEGIEFIKQLVQLEGSHVLRRLRLINPDVNSVFDVENPRVAEMIRQNTIEFARQVNETTNSNIRNAIARGVESGEGISDIANRIEGVFEDAIGYRSINIARTEVSRNATLAAIEGYKKSGVVEAKQFYTTPDDALCEECASCDNEIVGLDEQFSLGEIPIHPGCRCCVLPVIKEGD